MTVETVLVVDDDSLYLRALSREVRTAGKRVLGTGDAERGRELACVHSPELAIIDILLGPTNNVSGIALIRQLRDDSKVGFVIAQSAIAIANVWTHASEAGATLVVEKGLYSLPELLLRVERGTELPQRCVSEFVSLARASWEYANEVVRACGGIRPASRALRMDRSALQRKLKRRPAH